MPRSPPSAYYRTPNVLYHKDGTKSSPPQRPNIAGRLYASLAGKRGEIECIPAKADNHGPVKVRGLHDFEYADGTVYYPLGTTAYAWIHMSQAVQEKTLSSLKKAQFNKLRMCVFPKNYGLCKEEPEIYPFFVKGQVS